MNYPVSTPIQLRVILRALRKSRALSQAQAGQLLGVNQQRMAKIENAPSVTSINQISRLVSALGGRLVIEVADTKPPARAKAAKAGRSRNAAASATNKNQGTW